ncbi:MAG TPA: hypothetical protein VK698_34225 [Kofleriaceae bacterium]|nr:hypothetical protein [Kofleriaceae bacterium]
MTHKRKALSRLRDARGRLRDLDAARAAEAGMRLNEKERGLVAADRDMVSAVVRACDRLAHARHVNDLESAHEDLDSARGDVTEARQQMVVAAAHRQAATAQLRKRERDLRMTERVLERVTTAARREGDRYEQRMVDDLIGSRVARGDQ